MPTVLTEPFLQDPPQLLRKRWTRAQCEELEAMGMFDGEHLELIQGDLLNKKGKRRPHVNSATLLYTWLVRTFGDEFVNQEAPIDVAPEDNPTNEPEPDIIILKRTYLEFTSGNPKPEDLQLVAEIADSSLYADLKIKAELYARAGIVEYWTLDINSRQLIVHREPEGGRYLSIRAYGASEVVAPLGAPKAELRVADVFVK